MTVRTLALYVVPLALLGIGVVTLLVTKWQRKHVVFRDRKHPAE
jgi:cytochrome c-type biogenesis protein CcmH/NrfF